MTEFGGPTRHRNPVALGLSAEDGSRHLFEASRTLSEQLRIWANADGGPLNRIDSLWITHAHLGHIDGLGQFGCEAWGPKEIPIHASESMIQLIYDSPNLAHLFTNGHLVPTPFKDGKKVQLSPELSITPIRVPHRDELTDTYAFLIKTESARLLFLPDHDSWEETLSLHSQEDPMSWFRSLFVDIALLDATFWSGDELEGHARDIGHPVVEETLDLLGRRGPSDPRVILFHFNHTNPLHDEASGEVAKVRAMGWEIGRQGMHFHL
jgi:pyrroloquinoline quinone biosynthesis protein B